MSAQAWAAIIYVPVDYLTIQAGLDAAIEGDTVLVASGTYTGTGNINLDYQEKAITLLSESGPDSCIILTNGDERGISFESGETESSVCEGFTFRSESGPASIELSPLIYCHSSSPTIRGCKFYRFSGWLTSTCLYLDNSSAAIINCLLEEKEYLFGSFTGVYAVNSSPKFSAITIRGLRGLGVDHGFELINSTVDLRDCSIEDCATGFSSSPVENGGGISCRTTSLTMQDCTVQNCMGIIGGGVWLKDSTAAIYSTHLEGNAAVYGGGIAIEDSTALIEDSVIESNLLLLAQSSEAHYGAGVFCSGASSLVIRRTSILTNLPQVATTYDDIAGIGVFCSAPAMMIEECTFANNQQERNPKGERLARGGGICCTSGSIDRTTFTDNYAEWGGAVYGETVTVTDCTFMDNEATFGGALAIAADHATIAATTFSTNLALVGSHIVALTLPATITLAGCAFSGTANDYYLAPTRAFDLTAAVFVREPVTQDVYVNVTGHDANSGLDFENPFRTLTRALRSVVGSAENPITVHVAEGRYAATDENEDFPVLIPSYVTLAGSAMNRTLLSGELSHPVGFSYAAPGSKLQSLTIMNSSNARWGAFNCVASAPTLERCLITHSQWLVPEHQVISGLCGLYCWNSSPYLHNCIFTDNTHSNLGTYYGYWRGGAIWCRGNSSPIIDRCIVAANRAEFGGGLYCEHAGSPWIVDSVFYANTSEYNGAAIYAGTESTLTIFNSLFIANEGPYKGITLGSSAVIVGSTFDDTFIHCRSSTITITDSILWSRQGSTRVLTVDQVAHPTITYCDIKGGYEGQGNFESDPLFAAGPWGSYYLSPETSNQSDSPCVDAGSQAAAKACYTAADSVVCYDSLTTAAVQALDFGALDIGYHYWPKAIPDLEVELDLPLTVFRPGDHFVLTLTLINNSEATVFDVPVAVVLQAYGHYYCYPTWNESFQLVLLDFIAGVSSEVLLDFYWPDDPSEGAEVEFFAAPLYWDVSGLVCEPGYVQFGWEPQVARFCFSSIGRGHILKIKP